MAQHIIYGLGGFDESKPDNNVISVESIPDPPELSKTIAQVAAEHDPIETIGDVEAFRQALVQLGVI